MRLLVTTILAAALAAPAADAAERSLIAPFGSATVLDGAPAAAATLGELRAEAASQGRVKVVVGLKVPFAAEGRLQAASRADQRRDIAAAANSLRNRFAAAAARGGAGAQSFSSLPFLALEVTPAELDRLAADPLVISISENIKLRASLAQSTAIVRAPQAWAAGYTGLGQTIAILDTGVDKTHPFLAGKVVDEACFSLGGYCPGGAQSSFAAGSGLPCPVTDQCAHGTHVAGIAAGRGDSASGVARNANLISIQVFSPDREEPGNVTAWFSDILAALNHVYEIRDGRDITAVNLSLGGGGSYSRNCDTAYPAMTAAIANLASAGIATIVAAGNDGWAGATSFPACISGAVSVGAVSDEDWGPCFDNSSTATDKVACYSNDAAFVSLLAPGSAISSSVPGGGYDTWHGTSMAAPHVAGAFAVLREKMPDASVGDMLFAFQTSGKLVTDHRTSGRRTLTRPRIDVAAALDQFVTLSFTRSGAGSGSVTFTTPRGTTTCSGSCSIGLVTGSLVRVTAQPAAGSALTAWSGACSGSGACSFTIRAAAALGATFGNVPVQTLTYTSAGSGTGTVSFTPAGTNGTCTANCSQAYSQGTLVRLSASSDANSTFSGWSGACSGTRDCSITMTKAKAVTATFTIRPPQKKKGKAKRLTH